MKKLCAKLLCVGLALVHTLTRAPAQPPTAQAESGAAKERQAALVWIQAEAGGKSRQGCGFVFSADGYVLTHYDLVEGQKEVIVHAGGERYLGKVFAQEPRSRVAIVKFDGKNLATLVLGNADKVTLGEEVELLTYQIAPGAATATYRTDKGKVIANELKRVGLFRLPVIEAELPREEVLAGSPITNAKTGEVVGIVMADGGLPSSPYLGAMGINVAFGMIQSAGLKVQAPTRPATTIAQKEILEGLLLNPRLVDDWQFATGVNTGDLKTRRHIQSWRELAGITASALTPMTRVHGRVYFGTLDRRVYALDPNARQKQWDFRDLDYPMTFSPTVSDQIICCATGDVTLYTPKVTENILLFNITRTERKIHTKGYLHGLDPNTGQQKWRTETGFCSAPHIVGESVFFGGLGIRGALNTYDGKPIWVKDDQLGRGDRDRSIWFDLAYADGNVLYYLAVPIKLETRSEGMRLVGDGHVKVLVIDAANGNVRKELPAFELNRRKGNNERPLGAAMVVDADSQGQQTLYCLAGQELCAVAMQSGQAVTLKWQSKRKDGKPYAFVPQIAVHDGIVYVATEDRKLYAINARTGEEVWTQPYAMNARPGPPIIYEGVVYLGTADGYLHAVAAREGTLLWRYETGGEPVGHPVAVKGENGDVLYMGSSNGKLYAIKVPQR